MVDVEAEDHLEEAQALLRGASQMLQALAAEPDCVETGECLDVLSGVVEDALRYVEAARGRIARAEGGNLGANPGL